MKTAPDKTAPGGFATLAATQVARIGFGAMQAEHAPETAPAILRRAVELGVNHVDTAEFYGSANALIRSALAPYPADLALVTKVGAVRADANLVPAQRPEELRASVLANLTSLGAEHVAVVNLRRIDSLPSLVATGSQLVDLDSQLAELVAMRDEGLIGGIGLSGVSAEQLRQALPAGIACVQNLYSVLDRAAEPVLDVCREHGVAWVPFFPLGSAFADRPKVTSHPTVGAVASAVGATPAQVGLAWLLGGYERTLLIPGTTDPAHLEENIAAGTVHLDPAAMATLDKIAGRPTV